MKHFTFLTFVSVAAASLLIGCKPSSPSGAADQATATQKLDQAKQDTQAAMGDLKDYAYDKKTEYAQKMRDELAEVNKEIDELEAKIAQGTDDLKAAAKPKMAALHAKADTLKAQLDKVEDSTESTWDSFKDGVKGAYADLKKSCDDARQWLSDKIAPSK